MVSLRDNIDGDGKNAPIGISVNLKNPKLMESKKAKEVNEKYYKVQPEGVLQK